MKRGFNKKTFPLLLVTVALLYACIPEPLPVRLIPVVKPEIVVNTQIIPGESVVVLLTKTFGALDADENSDPEDLLAQLAVDDAVVILSSETQIDTLLNLGNGIYGGVFIDFQEGQTYRLYVQSESLGVVTAETQVLAPVPFDDIEASLYFTGFDDTLAQITYSVLDPVEQNWYM